MQTRTTPESIFADFEMKEYNLAQIDQERAKFSVQCGTKLDAKILKVNKKSPN